MSFYVLVYTYENMILIQVCVSMIFSMIFMHEYACFIVLYQTLDHGELLLLLYGNTHKERLEVLTVRPK